VEIENDEAIRWNPHENSLNKKMQKNKSEVEKGRKVSRNWEE
jgi:hypothetical protein